MPHYVKKTTPLTGHINPYSNEFHSDQEAPFWMKLPVSPGAAAPDQGFSTHIHNDLDPTSMPVTVPRFSSGPHLTLLFAAGMMFVLIMGVCG